MMHLILVLGVLGEGKHLGATTIMPSAHLRKAPITLRQPPMTARPPCTEGEVAGCDCNRDRGIEVMIAAQGYLPRNQPCNTAIHQIKHHFPLMFFTMRSGPPPSYSSSCCGPFCVRASAWIGGRTPARSHLVYLFLDSSVCHLGWLRKLVLRQ